VSCRRRAPRRLARDCRLQPPRQATTLARCRLSFRTRETASRCAGLRGFAGTRDSDLWPGPSGIARAIRHPLDAVSMAPDPRPSSRPLPAVPRDARRQPAPAARPPISVRRSSSGIRREEARGPLRWPNAEGQARADGRVSGRNLAVSRRCDSQARTASCQPYGARAEANADRPSAYVPGAAQCVSVVATSRRLQPAVPRERARR
jgi:hypothetical protein